MKAKHTISIILLVLFALLLPLALVLSNLSATLFNQEKLTGLLVDNVFSDQALPQRIKEMTIFEAQYSDLNKTLDMRMMTNVLGGIEAEKWLELFGLILPEETRVSLTNDLVGGLFAWLDTNDPYPDVVIPVTDMLGGVQENILPVTAWVFDAFRVPPCSDELVAGFAKGEYGADPTTLITCTPPAEMTGEVVAATSVMLGGMIAEQAPSEDIIVADQISAMMSEEEILSQKATINRARRLLPLAWVLPILLFLVAAALVIRSVESAIAWLQWPLFATGLTGLILGFRLANPISLLEGALLPPPAGVPAPGIAVVFKLLESLLSQIGTALLWQTIPLLVIGAGMLAYSYRETMKTVPAELSNFFKSLVPPTLEENA